MDRRQLRTFLAVVDQRSFSAAARLLDTVQSNVSAHIARLEKELGVTLIDRATNEPTAEGHVVASRARRIESEFDALDSDVASLRDTVSGTVRLGAIGTTARWLAPHLLDRLAGRYPELTVVVLDATTSSLVPNLLDGRIDLAVLNLPVDDPELSVVPLFEEDRVLVVPSGHPLSGRSAVSLAEIAAHELLLEAQGTAFRDELDAAAARQGLTFRTKAEFDGMRLLASLAFAGYGAAIVPASAAPASIEGDWELIEATDVPGRSVGLVQRRRGLPSAAQRVVADELREVIETVGARQRGIRPVASGTRRR
ncbi:MAG: LysR family transcriptional regulator [Actinomycetes bacterium]